VTRFEQSSAQLAKGLAILFAESVEQCAPRRIGQRFEDHVSGK
jgi:hypothetical protein